MNSNHYNSDIKNNIISLGDQENSPALIPQTINEISEKRSPSVEGGLSATSGRGGEPIPNSSIRLNNLPYLKTFRKKLRNNCTPAEDALWFLLKGKKLDGRKFRRQHSFGHYILDFYCPSERIAIELDGQGHFEASQAEYDSERDLMLEYFGIRVLRFENKVVWDNPSGLLERVRGCFGKQPLSPSDSSPS